MTTIKCLVIPADKDVAVRVHEFEQGDLKAMQALVGGLVAAVDIGEPEVTIWNHDEAKLIEAPLNHRATLLWWCGENRFMNVDVICGDVFITGLSDDDGNTTSIPQDFLDLVLNTEVYKYEILTFNGGAWAGNNMRFDDYWDATHQALCLAERWKLVEHTRVVAA
jgi:hypothetical protein